MQAEQKSVELELLDRGDNRITEPVKRFASYFTAWPRCGTEYMSDLPLVRSTRVEEPGKWRIRLASFWECLVANQHITVDEGRFVSFLNTERIRFVRNFGSQNIETH